jgi:ABC-type molybdenum transport system ATPase subunit/photorepair protein PhrA
MDLTKSANDLVADYSHGMKKKIALSAALLPAPRLLFLDEPFEGIDAIASRQIGSPHRLCEGQHITTHILEIVERLCDTSASSTRAASSRRDRWRSCGGRRHRAVARRAIHGHHRRDQVDRARH